jgi:hypothetical protein
VSAPVGNERALRFTGRFTRRMWISVVAWLVLTPLLTWLALTGTSLGSGTSITIVACALAVLVFGPQLVVYLRIRGLHLAGDQLVRGGRSCDLTTSWDIDLEVSQARSRRLYLHADDLRVVLGSMTIPSYYEPDDLRRLATILGRSKHPGPREVGEQLTRLANDPRQESWPLPRSR